MTTTTTNNNNNAVTKEQNMTTTTTKTTKRRNGFSRVAGSTYACDTCGRRTRNTGAQSLGSKTCPQCFDLAGIENEISDGNATLAERRDYIDELIADIRAKGGNPDENFASLLATTTTTTTTTDAPALNDDHAPTSREIADANRRAHDPASFERLATLKAAQPSTPEQRQIARVLTFAADVVLHIDWNKVAQTARELGAHFEARTTDAGACVITMFWAS
jgi:hypothetical protein